MTAQHAWHLRHLCQEAPTNFWLFFCLFFGLARLSLLPVSGSSTSLGHSAPARSLSHIQCLQPRGHGGNSLKHGPKPGGRRRGDEGLMLAYFPFRHCSILLPPSLSSPSLLCTAPPPFPCFPFFFFALPSAPLSLSPLHPADTEENPCFTSEERRKRCGRQEKGGDEGGERGEAGTWGWIVHTCSSWIDRGSASRLQPHTPACPRTYQSDCSNPSRNISPFKKKKSISKHGQLPIK